MKTSQLTFRVLKSPYSFFYFFFWVFILTGTTNSQNQYLTSINSLSKKENAFWLNSNQNGLMQNGSFSAFSILGNNNPTFRVGVTIIKNNKNVHLPSAYIISEIKDLTIAVGRIFNNISNESSLSSGSLIRGNNAIPIPQISLYKSSYKELALSPIKIWYKWGISHGWFSKEDYIKAPMLHEKYFYLEKPLKNNSSISLGIIHEAIWGGETLNHGKQPDSISDYFRVVTFQSASYTAIKQEQINALGNHLGIWDIVFSKKLKTTQIKLYYQHPFEDRSGMYQHFFDEIKALKFPSKSFDGLLGIEITKSKLSSISKLLYEYVNTMHQSGHEAASDSTYGWDNYYNHYIYQSGWTYKDRVIGNPLFTLGENKGHYSDGRYIINNRIRAHHFGISGNLSQNISYKALFTVSKNYGTYFDADKFNKLNKPYPFAGGMNQFSGLVQIDILKVLPNLNGQLSYAFDRGELFPNINSFLFSLTYQFTKLSLSH